MRVLPTRKTIIIFAFMTCVLSSEHWLGCASAFLTAPSVLVFRKGFSKNKYDVTASNNWRHSRSSKKGNLVIPQKIQHDESDDNKEEAFPVDTGKNTNPLAIFLKSLWQGIALPFPTLRRVVLHPALQSHSDKQKLSIGLSLREGVLALTAYLLLGVVAYSFVLEHWCIVDSLYFTCVCFSTVGYGDLCPTTPLSKLFTCLFGLGGIAFLGAAVATVGSRVVQAEMNAAKTARKQSTQRLLHIFDGMPQFLESFHKEQQHVDKQTQTLERRTNHHNRDDVGSKLQRWTKILARGVVKVIPSATIILVGGAIMQKLNGARWNWIESVYYSVVTASTIGFGDFSPQTRAAKLFATVFIPLSVAAAGELLSSIAMSLVDRRQRQVYTQQLEHDLTIEHLHLMDADKDGKITREEYVQFMLMEMGRVTNAELDELFTQFDRLDVTQSGYLDNEDLKLMAKLRGATVKE